MTPRPGPRGRLAHLVAPHEIVFREYEMPELADGALLLRTLAAGVCGSELHMYEGRHPLHNMVMGHEIVGEVTEHRRREVDSLGRPLRDGDRVTAPYFLTCTRCAACARGQFELCENAYQYWVRSPEQQPHFTGTHATHYHVAPEQWVFHVPENIPDVVAASINCGLSQVWAGIERAEIRAGERVVVQGAGGLGLYATAVAKERGATVIVIDAVSRRLEAAKAFGADAVIGFDDFPEPGDRAARVRELTGGEGADVGLELAGVPAAFIEGLDLLRPGARYVEIGNVNPGTTVTIDLGSITRRAISVLPVLRYKPWMLGEALAFVSRNMGRLPFEGLVDAEYTLDDLPQALADSEARTINRAVITFGD